MGLGKGLSALISDEEIKNLNDSYISDLSVDFIEPNRDQPRIQIEPETLVPLSDSIREHGIIEPIIVTKKGKNKYEIIAGERRWRAAKLAKIAKIPAVIKEATPQQMLELAIIENIHRKDLNPLEEAMAFQQLREMFNLTHVEIAKKLGCSRELVANKMRLLKLPEHLKILLLENKLQEGHARALLGLVSTEAMVSAAKIVVRDKLSVRAVEELVRRLNQGQSKPQQRNSRILDEYTQEIETTLRGRFGKKVQLFRSIQGGKIVIPFKNDTQLKKIYRQLSGK